MLDIMNNESVNEVTVSGYLNELEITKGTTADGRGWIRGTANILVDQSIGGEVSENIVPIRMFSMQNKKDGSQSKVYERILGYQDQFTSMAAAESKEDASRITVTGGKLEENAYYDAAHDAVRTGFQISANFLNPARNTDDEQAKFKLSGIVGKMRTELDREGNETGRLLLDFIVVGYNGKANVLTLVATDSKKAFIEEHWEAGDTVQVTGYVHMTYKVETWEEEQGFGEPIQRSKTVSCKELVVSGGSPCGMDDEYSYDADEVKLACERRLADHEKLKKPVKKAAPKMDVLGF